MEWISVKQSLPEKGKPVLVCLKGKYVKNRLDVDYIEANLCDELDFRENWGNPY